MDNLDEEIKQRLQRDELISKKAEDIFENFFKEENFMEENLKENKEEFVNTPNPSNKPNKTSKWRKALPIAACLVVALGGGNIYASTQGYGNVFFLVKYLVTGDKSVIKGKDAILSDRDITISYETIKLTENIRMQIRNFQVKDNEAKLILAINEANLEKDTKVVPLRYKVYNSSNELLCDKRSAKAYDQYLSEYTEELVLNNYNQDDNILILEVYKSNDEKLAKITIDLNTREITIDGEEEALQKVSEIELKKYLGFISEFEQTNKNNDDGKIHFAEAVITNIKDGKGYTTNNGYAYEVSEVNGILESLGYEKVSDTFKKGELFQRRTINGTDYFDVLSPTGGFEPNTVIEISDISYCAGLYTAEFSYAFIKSDDSFNTDYSNVDKKVATIYFKVNEDDKYSKFKVVKYVEVVDNGLDSNNEESITLSQAEAEKVLKEKFELLEKLYFSPYGYFKMDSEYVEQGCRILNFEEAVNTNFTKNMAKTIKEYLPMGVHIYNGQYYAADYGGYLPYSGLSGFENIVITSDTITANVVTKRIDPNDNALPNKINQIKIIKNGDNWLIDSFDVANVFNDNLDDISEVNEAIEVQNNETNTTNTTNTSNTSNEIQTNTTTTNKESTNDILNNIKTYFTQANNNAHPKVTFRKYENETTVKDAEEGSNILNTFLGKINDKITNIDNTTTYNEWCKREVKPAEEKYIMMFMYDGHQTIISWDSNNENEIDMSWYNNEKKTIEIDKIQLITNAKSVFEALMEFYGI